MKWQWIDQQADLAQALSQPDEMIGVDTEFVRESTFWPIPGLIQIGNREQVYLIDPLAQLDYRAFSQWLTNRQQIKVTHAGFEDLELFAFHFGAMPDAWFDTQLAMACLGGPISMGLDALVQQFGFPGLDKTKSRNDWTRRPLGQDLLHYAAQDVVYLPEIAADLRDQLDKLDRLHWLAQEQSAVQQRIQGLLDGAGDPMDRVKGLHNLSGQGLAVMRGLVGWRDQVARAENLARARVVRDELLLALADSPQWPNLADLPGYRGSSTRAYATALEGLYRDGQAKPAEQPIPRPQKPSAAERKATQGVKQAVNRCAEYLGIAPEFLAKRRDIESWASGKDEPRGWRADALKEYL